MRTDNKGQDMINITQDDGFFPPLWNMNEYPEKTDGWIQFQIALKKDPEFYLYQPERSKREDSFCKVCQCLINEHEQCSDCLLDKALK